MFVSCWLWLLALLSCTVLGQHNGGFGENVIPEMLSDSVSANAADLVSQSHPFRLFPVCNTNFTSCIVRTCQPHFDFLNRCVYCRCNAGSFTDETIKQARSVMIEAASTRLNLTQFTDDNGWLSNGFGKPLGDVLMKKKPFIIRNMEKVKEMKPTVQDLKQALAKHDLTDAAIGLPVVVVMSGKPYTAHVGNIFEKSKGVVDNLSFLKKTLQTEPVVSEFFDSCQANIMPYDMDDSMQSVYQQHWQYHQAYDFTQLLWNTKIYDAFADIVIRHSPMHLHYDCFTKSAMRLSRSQYKLFAIVKKFADALNGSAEDFGKLRADLKSSERNLSSVHSNVSKEFLTMIENLTVIADLKDFAQMLHEFSRVNTTRLYHLTMRSGDVAENLRQRNHFLKDLIDSLVFLEEFEPHSPKDCMQSMLFDQIQNSLPNQNGVVEHAIRFMMNHASANISRILHGLMNATDFLMGTNNLSEATQNTTHHSWDFFTIWDTIHMWLDAGTIPGAHIFPAEEQGPMNIYDLLIKHDSILEFLNDISRPIDKIATMLAQRPPEASESELHALAESHDFIYNMKTIGMLNASLQLMDFHNFTNDQILTNLNISMDFFKHSQHIDLLKNFTEMVKQAIEMHKVEFGYNKFSFQGQNISHWMKGSMIPPNRKSGYNATGYNNTVLMNQTFQMGYNEKVWPTQSTNYQNHYIPYDIMTFFDRNRLVMGCPSWIAYDASINHVTYDVTTSFSPWLHESSGFFSPHISSMNLCQLSLIQSLNHLDFQTVMSALEQTLCNKSMNFDDDEARMNMTLKLIRNIKNFNGNKTFDQMLKRLNDAAPLISADQHMFMAQLISNMSSLHDEAESEKTTVRIMVDEILKFKMNKSMSRLYNIRGIEEITTLIGQVSNFSDQLKMICRIAEQRGVLKEMTMPFGDVMMSGDALFMLDRFLDYNVTSTVAKFRRFLTAHYFTIDENITMENFTDLVRTSGWWMLHLSNKYLGEFHRNMTKIVHHVPRLNTTQHRICLKMFKTASEIANTNPYEVDMPRVSCLIEILLPFFAGDSPFGYLYNALKNIVHFKNMTLHDPTMKNESAPHPNAWNNSATNSCRPRLLQGLLMGESLNSTSMTDTIPVHFKHFRGALINNNPFDMKLITGILWINLPQDFDVNQIFGARLENTTTVDSIDFGFENLVPVLPNDEIMETFVNTDENDEISVKAVFNDGTVAMWRVSITKGRWFVKDNMSMPARRRREVGQIGLVEDIEIRSEPSLLSDIISHASEHGVASPPEGWRRLQHRDTISSEARLKLLPNLNTGTGTGFSIGIIAFLPLNASGASTGISKPRNLIVTSFKPPHNSNATINSTLKIPIRVIAGQEYILKIGDVINKASALQNADLDLLRAFAGVGNAGSILKRIEDEMIHQFLRLEGLHETVTRAVDISYKVNASGQWENFQPDQGFRLLRNSEIRFKVKLDSTNEMYRLKIKFGNAKLIEIIVQVYAPRPTVTMLVPQDYHLPPVPFNIDKYEGFSVSKEVALLLSSLPRYDDIIGIAVLKAKKNKIGTWQALYSSSSEWVNIENTMSKQINEADTAVTDKKCSAEEVILLSPDARLRFLPHQASTFWKSAQAWVESTVTLSLYRIVKNMTETENIENALHEEGLSRVIGTFNNEECQTKGLIDFKSLLTSSRRIFAIERLGCDGRRSSTKTKFDKCGICGGNGESCMDCNSEINGTAYYDSCRICVNGTTGKLPTKLDCARTCTNNNYLDECGFCQERGVKKRDLRDCNGTCFGSAKFDRCGACRMPDGLLLHLPAKATIVDACGKCGGDNTTCAGCDAIPNSGKVTDKCGNCKMLSDPTFNEGCGNIFYISRVFPSVLVLKKNNDQAHIIIDGYFNTHKEVSCILRHNTMDTIVKIGLHKVMKLNSKLPTDAVHTLGKVVFNLNDLLPQDMTYTNWNLTCERENDRATFMTPIFVRTTNPWGLLSIEPEWAAVNSSGGSVTIMAKQFPDVPMDLVCGGIYYSTEDLITTQEGLEPSDSGGSTFLKSTRAFKVDAQRVDVNSVRCTFPNSVHPLIANVHVLSKMEIESSNPISIARSVTGGLTFEYREKAPSVKEAKISDNLNFIWISFDVDVRLVNEDIKDPEDMCKFIILESDILGQAPLCFMRGMRYLLIRPGKTATIPVATARSADQVIGKITLKAGVFQGRGATELMPQIEVQLHMPSTEVSPKVYLRAPGEMEPCEAIKFDIGIIEGIGAWRFEYQWSVEGFENNSQAVIYMLKEATDNKRKTVLKWSDKVGMMQPGRNYTISVSATNAFNKRGPVANMTVRVKDHNSALRVYVVGSNEKVVKTVSNLNLEAYAQILKPKCQNEKHNDSLNAESFRDVRIEYVWEAYHDDDTGAPVDLENANNRKLTIQRGILRPGVYLFKVTAVYFKDDKILSASTRVKVTVDSSQVIAKIIGPKSRLVTTGEQLIIDGSRSVDPDGGVITHKWTCVEFETGAPCSVNSADGVGMERADAVFPEYQEDGVLTFPGRLLTPGIVIKMTLTVQSENRTATDDVYVFILDENSHLPAISFSKAKALLKDYVPTNKVLRLTADIIGNTVKNWTMTLRWSCIEEEGLSCVDFESASRTPTDDTKEIIAGRRTHFSLVIKKNALQPGSSYKFRLQATPDRNIHPLEEGEENIVIYADVQISTSQIATGGSLEFSPSNGSALTTEFTLSAVDWLVNDDESDTMFYRFAFKSAANLKNGKSRLSYLGPFSDRPEITTVLPAGFKNMNHALSVILLVRIAENDDSIQKAMTTIPVVPMTVEDSVIDDIKSQAAEALVSGNRDETVANILLLQGVVQSNVTKLEIKDLADQTIKKMEAFYPKTEREAGDALDDARNLLGSFDGDVTLSDESKEISLRLVEVTLSELYKKTDSAASPRRKRSVTDDDVSISETMAVKILQMYDTVFFSTGSSSDLRQRTQAKFEEDSGFIMSSLCSSVGFDEPSSSVDTGYTLISAKKVTMPTSESFGQDAPALTFTLSNVVQSQFSNWDCDAETTTCPGACVSYGFYNAEAIKSNESALEPLGDRISPITAVFIRNPSDGSVVSDSSASSSGTENHLVIQYFNLTLPTGVTAASILCRHRDASDVWESSSCEAAIDPSNTVVTCSCNVFSGYFALFTSAEVATSTMQMTDSISSTAGESSCPADMKFAETCNEFRLCIDDTCEIGKTCVCTYSVSGSSDQCIATCPSSDAISTTTESVNPPPPPSDRMTTGAIIGLIIALIIVTAVLLMLVKYYYTKAKQGRVTPTNSQILLDALPPAYESSQEKRSSLQKAEPNDYEMTPMPNAPPQYYEGITVEEEV